MSHVSPHADDDGEEKGFVYLYRSSFSFSLSPLSPLPPPPLPPDGHCELSS
jgi:hypothetical protein